jgi:uncharacterized peroxidase-related enzyme
MRWYDSMQAMARVSYVGEDELPRELQALYARFAREGHFENQARTLAHAPAVFRHVYGLVQELREEGSLPPRLIEIAVVATSAANRCKYCVGHHAPVLKAQGLAPGTVERILERDVPGLDAVERLVRDYALLVNERPWGIQDKVFEELRRHFNERQIVELTARIGLCGLFNRLNDALQIEPEAGIIIEGDSGHQGR